MAKRSKTAEKKNVAVIGLGRFGEAVALRLVELGHEVVGIDGNAEIVQKLADDLPHVVQADSTEAEALRALGVNEVDYAVVAIGASLEGSVLSVLALQELGDDVMVLNLRGSAREAVGNREGAKESYRQASRVDPIEALRHE